MLPKSVLPLSLSFFPALLFAQQVLVVDDSHSQMTRPGEASAAIYVIQPADKIIIDASKYQFKLPPQFAGKPINSLQVVIANEQQYSASWDTQKAKAVLSSQTLMPNSGSIPFSGFAAGKKMVLAIGNLDGANFNVLWVGMAEVK